MGFLDIIKKASVEVDEEVQSEEEVPNLQQIEDVLEILQIDPTFEIPDNVYLAGDLKGVNFDKQVPYGFDEGQVMNFISSIRNSLEFLSERHKQRNEDVAKLASVIDKLQVETNNLKFDSEVAQGINIMPSSDEMTLETQLTEALLENKLLEDKLSKSGNSNGSASALNEERQRLLDELSVSRRENEQLEEEILSLKAKLNNGDDEDEETSQSFNIKLPTDETDNDNSLPTISEKSPEPIETDSLPTVNEDEKDMFHSLDDDYDDSDEDDLDALLKKMK